jgi:hypothetical protein
LRQYMNFSLGKPGAWSRSEFASDGPIFSSQNKRNR